MRQPKKTAPAPDFLESLGSYDAAAWKLKVWRCKKGSGVWHCTLKLKATGAMLARTQASTKGQALIMTLACALSGMCERAGVVLPPAGFVHGAFKK